MSEILNADSAFDTPCGIVIDPKNTLQLKDAILKILENPEDADQFSSNAIKKVNQEYNIQSVTNNLITIWETTKNANLNYAN